MTSMIRSPSHVTHVPRPRLHPQELRFQEFEVKFLVTLLLLIMEKLPLTNSQNFNFFYSMMVQHL